MFSSVFKSPAPSDKSEPPAKLTFTSWEEILDEYCTAKSATLVATKSRVQKFASENNKGILLDSVQKVQPWNNGACQDVILQKFKTSADNKASTNNAPTTSKLEAAGRVLKGAYNVVNAPIVWLTKPLELKTDYDDVEYNEEDFAYDDDAVVEKFSKTKNTDNDGNVADKFVDSNGNVIGDNIELLNTELAVNCLEYIKSAIKFNKSESGVVSLEGNDSGSLNEILQKYDKATASTDPVSASFIQQLPYDQLKFLLHILEKSGTIEMRTLQSNTAIAWGPDASSEIAIWELNQAKQTTEDRIATWQAQADECAQRALQAKKQPQQKRKALYEMKRRNYLLQNIDQAYNTLLNVEQVLYALDTARHQTGLVQALGQASETLQQFRVQSTTNMDNLDNILDNVTEGVEHVSNVNISIDSLGGGHVSVPDDEELLQELEQLTINEPTLNNASSTNDEVEAEPMLPTPVKPGTAMGQSDTTQEDNVAAHDNVATQNVD